eukprot:3683183-Prymnesium_polylepis.2
MPHASPTDGEALGSRATCPSQPCATTRAPGAGTGLHTSVEKSARLSVPYQPLDLYATSLLHRFT